MSVDLIPPSNRVWTLQNIMKYRKYTFGAWRAMLRVGFLSPHPTVIECTHLFVRSDVSPESLRSTNSSKIMCNKLSIVYTHNLTLFKSLVWFGPRWLELLNMGSNLPVFRYCQSSFSVLNADQWHGFFENPKFSGNPNRGSVFMKKPESFLNMVPLSSL